MATHAPDALTWLATEWERAVDSAERRHDAATFGGIVGDLAHRKTGGYHISRDDLPRPDYSVKDYVDDKQGPSDVASAVDIKMLLADMVLVTGRLRRSWRDVRDSRLDHCRGINGTENGRNAVRFDCQSGAEEEASPDHLWHVHLEVLRRYANDMPTMRGILSVITGEPNRAREESAVATSLREDRMYPQPIPVGPQASVILLFPFGPEDHPGMSIGTDTGPSGQRKAQWRVAKHTAAGWGVTTVATDTQDVRRHDVALDAGTDRVTVTRVQLDKDDQCDTIASVLAWW